MTTVYYLTTAGIAGTLVAPSDIAASFVTTAVNLGLWAEYHVVQ